MADETARTDRLHQRVRRRVSRRWEATLSSDTQTNALIFALVILAGVAFLGVAYAALHPVDSFSVKDKLSQLSAAAEIEAPFSCERGKSILALFRNREVRITLSDGREITLPQVASQTGASYGNPDGSFVFFNKGNEAYVREKGLKTYEGCQTNG